MTHWIDFGPGLRRALRRCLLAGREPSVPSGAPISRDCWSHWQRGQCLCSRGPPGNASAACAPSEWTHALRPPRVLSPKLRCRWWRSPSRHEMKAPSVAFPSTLHVSSQEICRNPLTGKLVEVPPLVSLLLTSAFYGETFSVNVTSFLSDSANWQLFC